MFGSGPWSGKWRCQARPYETLLDRAWGWHPVPRVSAMCGGRACTFINKYENVWVLYTARKMLSSCQLTLVQKTQFYVVNWVLCKDKTNHACFLYRLFRNLPATICEGTKKHAFHRRGAQVFSAWENDAPSWRLFPGNAFYGIGELVPSHGQGQLHPWPPRAQDRANARVQLQACMPRASIRLAWHGKERTWHL